MTQGHGASAVAITLAVLGLVATSGVAAGAAEEPPIAVTANGNAVTGGLSFAPKDITGRVGQVVRWTDTDFIAPHTVTENHGLFDLVGNNVNGTPISPSGFGPGSSVDLTLPAGTIAYFCRVHPEDMKGVLSVPATLVLGPALKRRPPAKTALGRKRRAARVRAYRRTLTITWAVTAPSDGQVFDVETRQGADGPWKPLATGTTKTATQIKASRFGKVTVTGVRVRLRRADDPRRATDWSPVATVTA